METIVKKKHNEAHSLIDGFLQRHLEKHGGKYVQDLYDYLCADWVPGQVKTKKALQNILLEEQNGRCCYCMKRIEGLRPEQMSIEHVIVNHPNDANDYNQYLGRNSQLDKADIIRTDEFIEKQVPPPPYPHSVAYENMLMSCDGKCHVGSNTPFSCNNKRLHEFVVPLPLMPNINAEIKYMKDGYVYWNNETSSGILSVDILGLNNGVLRIIRRIWYKLAIDKINPQECNRQDLVYEVLGDMLDDGSTDADIQTLFLFANNNWYWELLLRFDYFNDPTKFE